MAPFSGVPVGDLLPENDPILDARIRNRIIDERDRKNGEKRKEDRYLVRGNGKKFTLNELEKGRWRLFGIDLQGSQKRPRFEARSLEEAINIAEGILFGPQVDPSALPIADVFVKWREQLTCSEATKKEYWDGVQRACDWFDENQLFLWKDLRLEHLQSYSNQLSGKRYSKRYVQILCKPVRQCARWAARNWPDHFRNWTEGVVITGREESSYAAGRGYLSFEQLLGFLKWLEENDHWNILPGVALQGLCACRLRETVRLKWENVDLESRTVTIEGQVKNVQSIRRLPLPQAVWKVLEAGPRDGDRVLDKYQGPERYKTYGRQVRRLLQRWDPECRIEPKGLRRTLPSEAIRGGWAGYALERYLGHSAQGITEKHYVAASGVELVDLLRRQVVEKVDGALETVVGSGSPDPVNVIPLPTRGMDRKKVQKKCSEKDKKVVSANPNSQKP